ncbi:Uncharacterized protein TPAR_00995 [Tolypocladium paradoxum]|uniref:Uncharacterized protein n=1 Tax=Tolypocladium paradoxum TaxID=94208 RepID=A0A2S4L8P7_9HYPO|nr:Uncharacterized protein TPAR_00995 [Tolypocladium paradoxum]
MEPRRDHRFDPFASGAQRYNHDPDLDFSKLDFSDPSTMSQILGMSVPHKSPADVRRDAQRLSASVFASYEKLQAILARHEATIQKRWAKKKKQQRLDTMTSAWGPGMPTAHRPDFEAFRKESNQQRDKGTQYRDHFMWPHINQEDLLKPKTLLLLLNARGRHHASEFAGADFEAMHLGLVTKGVVPVFLNEHVMILHGAQDTQEYGKLMAWSEHPDAFEWMHTRKQFLPGEGLLILEAQQRTLEFLVKCCEHILHDIPPDTLTADAFPLQPEPHLKSEKETDGFESLAVMAAEAPYRLPARLDLDRIESLLRAKVLAAEDHVWALREDPGYFAEQLAETKEHRQEMLKDLNGDIHPALRPGKQGTFWARVVGNTVFEAYFELEVYAELHCLAKELQLVHAKYATSISPTKDLPDEFLGLLLKFRHYLNQAAKGPLGQLKQSVVASPPWRRFHVREPPVDADSTLIRIRSKSGVKMNKTEGHLIWLLGALWEDDQQLFLMSMPLVLDELERLLQAEPQAKELVTAYIAQVIGNLSIISQCMTQLDLYQPWARSFESNLVEREDGIKEEYAERTRPWAKMMAALKENALTRAAKLGDPSGNKFAYPSEKRRTKENTATLLQAERNLDVFWATIDRLMYNGCGSLEGTAVGRLLSQQRSLQRTREWVEEPAAANNKGGQQRSINVDIEPIYKPLSTLYFELPGKKREDSSQTLAPPKAKTKTRGTASQETPEATTAAPGTEACFGARAASIHVDARALKVFRTLFFDPTVTSSPGEVSWNDFLYAMTSTGIFAAEKLYGSVWQFQRVDGVDQSRIQFHEPHPHGKIPFVVARRHGRRLNRNYGWVGDMFILKGKP